MSPVEALVARFDTPHTLDLRVADVPIRVQTNDPEVWARLARYYTPWVVVGGRAPSMVVRLLQGRAPAAGAFEVVQRRDGKGPKEAVREMRDGRLVLKLQTGVLMALWPGGAFAVGDLRLHLNQGVNLINNCYAAAILRRGYRLLHASAVTWKDTTVALAGPPGAGKSTAALGLVEAGFRFLSNDRVLARSTEARVEAFGYPKQPRVNPGTLLHHPRLAALLSAEERARLAAMPPAQLWELEDKRDVDLEAVYGPGAVDLEGTLGALVLLEWRLGSAGFQLERLAPDAARATAPLVAKDLGVFDLDRRSGATADGEAARYAPLLARVPVFRVTGGVAVDRLVDAVRGLASA